MVTIFIHGTLPPKAICKLPIVNNFFYCPEGLTLASDLNLDSEKIYHLAQVPFILQKSAPEDFQLDQFYLYGWSGDLSHQARLDAAFKLYELIKQINCSDIRIITHSHGGNVALNLKAVAEKHEDKNFIIHELILLACPVQKITSEFIKSSIFIKKYVFHSHADLFQIIDPQGIYNFIENFKQNKVEFGPLFSERHFDDHPDVFHVKMVSNNRPLLHVEFLLEKFLYFLPKALNIIKSTENLSKEILIDIDLNN